MSIYVLCDFGLNPSTAHIIYKAGITIEMIKNDESYLYECLGKGSVTKIENVKQALENCNNYEESVYVLLEFGLSKTLVQELKEKYISLEDIAKSESIEDFAKIYGIGMKNTEKIFNAYEQYKGNEFVVIKKDYSKKVLEILKNIKSFSINIDEIKNNIELKELNISEEEIEYALNNLVKKNNIVIDNNIINVKYKSLREYIQEIKKDEWRNVFVRNLNGETLADIGKDCNITRERARQIFNRALQSINKIDEEKYLQYYLKYSWTKECFCEIFNIEPIAFEYFTIKYEMGTRDALELLEKDFLNKNQKNILKKHLKLLTYKGCTIQAHRTKLIELILKIENEQVHLNEIIRKYNNVIENEFKDYNFESVDLNSISNTRIIEAVLGRSEYVLASYNRKYRYYDVDLLTEKDINSLVEMLNVPEGIYSADLFFDNNKELMNDIDIRDKYELHNLLRRIIKKENITFGRMPDICIGYTDKTQFLIEEVNLLSPISVDEFTQIIHTKYGHEPSTMYAYVYNYLPEFITNNILNTKVDEFSEKEIALIKQELTEDIYSIKFVKDFITDKFNKDYKKYLNNLNFNRAGLKIREQYVYKDTIDSIDGYLKTNILNNDIYVENQTMKNAGNSYKWVLCGLLIENKIFKIDEEKYITEKGLRNRGISIEDIKEYQRNVSEKLNEEPFNIFMLQKENTLQNNKLNRFGNIFIESVLQYAPQIKTARIEGNTIFIKSDENFTKFDFINRIVNKLKPISIKGINEYILRQYNFGLDLYDIRYLINKNIYSINIETDIVEECGKND